MDNMVILASFGNSIEAEVVKSYLESEGVTCMIANELTNQMFGVSAIDCKIEVPESELSHARDVMKTGGFERFLD